MEMFMAVQTNFQFVILKEGMVNCTRERSEKGFF